MATRSSELCLRTAAVLLLICGGGGGGGGPAGADAGRVLGLFYFPGLSHFVIFRPLLEELAARGHQVDVYSHFPLEKPRPNYTDFSLRGTWQIVSTAFNFDHLLSMNFFKLMDFHWRETTEMCRSAMEHPSMKKLASSGEHYDVVLVEIFGTDCAYGFAHKLGAPVIGLTSLIGLPYGQERVGNSDNPAYVPVANLPFTSHMSLWERVLNTAGKIYAMLGEKYYGRWPSDKLLREYFGEDTPSLDDLVRNTSLVMVNSHFSFNGARPAVPGYVEVGGMHVDPNPKLPEEMRAFLDGAGGAGSVAVSLGSLLPFEHMYAPQLTAFERVLGGLPQRVLWRVNGSALPHGQPANVFAKPWIPQNAVLSHPSVRLFIMHGGLGGSQEAMYWGVPTIVIPFFTDQRMNGRLFEEKGAGRVLHFWNITEESLREAVDDVLNNPSYRENARKLSREFRDRPQTPMETAVWWTEYVMRHKGAPQLRSAAVDLSWYQLLLLDVAAVLIVASVALVIVLRIAVRAVKQMVLSMIATKRVKVKNS